MGKIRFWLALLAAASVPLSYMVAERRQEKGQLERLRRAARKTAEDATDTTRERLSAAGEAMRGAAGTVADTASRVASGVVAAAPLVSALAQRNGGADEREDLESDDWKKYPQMIGR